MLGSAQPMIEAMLREYHNPEEAARLRPYFSGHRRDLPADGSSVDRDDRGALIDRLYLALADRVRSRTLRSRQAVTTC